MTDYTSVVLALMIFLSFMNWIFYAKKHYQGPRVALLVKHGQRLED